MTDADEIRRLRAELRERDQQLAVALEERESALSERNQARDDEEAWRAAHYGDCGCEECDVCPVDAATLDAWALGCERGAATTSDDAQVRTLAWLVRRGLARKF